MELSDWLVFSDVGLAHVNLLHLLLLLFDHGPDYILVLELGFLWNAAGALILRLIKLIRLLVVLLFCFHHYSTV